MKVFFQRVVAFVMAAFYALSIAPASELTQIHQAGRKTLDAYLERAQIQSGREKFEKIAEQGIGAAIAEWEQSSLELKVSDYDEWLLQKDALEEDLESYKEKSFEKWLQKKQNEQKTQIQKSALYEELQNAALAFSYKKADGTKTRIVSKDFIDEAKAQWSEIADAIVQKHLEEWNTANEGTAFLQDEALAVEIAMTNSLMNELLYDHASLKKFSDAEAATVVVQKLADDVDAQTTDSMSRLFNSLETELTQVDEDTVASTAQKEWLERFERELEAGLSKWDEAERSFLAARVEWEQSAEKIFINDNKKWMEAYNELEARKTQWAEKIEKQIQDGKAKWKTKFTNLENEIDEYFEEFQYKLALELQQKEQIVDAGIETYNQSREILTMAQKGISNWYARWGEKYKGLYSYWKTEDNFGKQTNLNIVTTDYLRNELNEWKNTFLSIGYNILFLYSKELEKRCNETLGNAGAYIPPEAAKIYEEYKNNQMMLKKKYNNVNESKKVILISLNLNSDFKYLKYDAKYIYEQQENIKSDCPALYQSISQSVWDCFSPNGTICKAGEQLLDWLDLYDKYCETAKKSMVELYTITGSALENTDYDEIENEKTKLSALEEYWESREKVAQAVYDYSQNSSSSLETATETKENLQKALENYQDFKDRYHKMLENVYRLQNEVKNAEEKYFSEEQKIRNLLSNIEYQHKVYDKLYDEWHSLKNNNYFVKLLYLNNKLESLEINDNDYETLLFEYCNSIQKEENIELTEKIKNIKELFENGNQNSDLSDMLTKEEIESLDIEDFELRETDINEYEDSRILSNTEIEKLKEKLERILANNSFSASLFEQILDDIKSIDKTDYEILKMELENSDSNENTRNCVLDILYNCKTQLEQRKAILLLLDGTLEEIESFFSENPDYSEVYGNYKDLSFALLNEKQKNAMTEIIEVINNHSQNDLDVFFTALDNASEGLGKAGIAILELYKKTLLNEKKSLERNIEAELTMKINNAFPDNNIIINKKNFHTPILESVFYKENPKRTDYKFQNKEEYTEEKDFSLLDNIESYNEVLFQLQEMYELSRQPQSRIAELESKMTEQEKNIFAAQKEYDSKSELFHGDSENSTLNLYIKACNIYNDALKQTQDFYGEMENARRKYRIAEEIYFYAENEYLHGNIDVESPLNNAREKLSEVRTALGVLAEIKEERDAANLNFDNCKELNDYKESTIHYYKARVFAYEYEQELLAQKENLYQAQLAEQAATERLVKDVNTTNFRVPELAKDFITATKTINEDGTYSYSFHLNSIGTINSRSKEEKERNNEILTEYYTDFSITSQDVYGKESSMTMAKHDALGFLNRMARKPYSIEEVALAVLFLKLQGNSGQQSSWLKSDENPFINSNYPMGSIPPAMHGVNFEGAYYSGRQNTLLNAYIKVTANGGEQDMAEYILFSETNINPSFELYQRQHDILSIFGLNDVVSAINERVYPLKTLAAIEMAVISTLSVIVLLPFFIGAWAIVPLAIATALYAVLTETANKLDAVKFDIRQKQIGCLKNLEIAQQKQGTYLSDWQAATQNRAMQEERLNILYCGKSKQDRKKITWNDFSKAIKEMTNGLNCTLEYNYFINLHNIDTDSKNLKDFFYEITKDEDFTSVNEVIQKMLSTLKSSNEEKTSILNEYVEIENIKKEIASENFYATLKKGANNETEAYKSNLKNAASFAWGKDSFDKTKFNKELISFYGKELLPSLPVRLGNPTEDYISDVCKNIKNVYLSQLNDEKLAQMSIKVEYFSLLENDLEEQYALWHGKINTAVEIGIDEWQKADDKLNAAYNSWQKEWFCEYGQKIEEWEKNYKEFLHDKQNWINQNYLQTGVSDPKTKNYAATSKIKTAINMENSIGDYISSLYDTDKFLRLADFTDTILFFADDDIYDISLLRLDKIDSSLSKKYDEIVMLQTEIESDMKKAAAQYQAEMLQWQMKQLLDDYLASIEEQNQCIEDWELGLVRRDGYTVNSLIYRNAIVDSTTFSTIRETQTVHRYRFFRTQTPKVAFDIHEYKGTSEYFIMKKIEEIQAKIQDWQEKTFGKTDNAGNIKTKGELQKHIGESPTFIPNVDLSKSKYENLLDPGSGEMGLIMLDYQWNSMRNSQGYAELSKPVYDQKLAQNSGWFKLPTLRQISSIACDILANCCMEWMRYIDDVLYGALDLGMGYKTFDEVLNDAARQTAIGFASGGISAASSAIFSGIGSTLGKGSQLLETTQKATTSYANNIASSYINSFDFVRGTMDWEQAAEAWTNVSNYTSAAGTMLGGALGEINNIDGNGIRLNQNVFSGIENMNSTIGGLSATTLNYLATGDISFNLVNIKGVGLFEIGIKDGEFSSGISEGGFDLSYSAIRNFVEGAKNAKKVSDIKKEGIESATTKLNTANLLGWSESQNNIELAKKLFDSEQEVVFAELDGDKTLSLMDNGKIIINSNLLSDNKDNQAIIASLIAYQNALNSSNDFSIKDIDFSKLKKGDGTAYTDEEIEQMKNKKYSDKTIGSLIDTARAFTAAHDILNSEYNSIANTENFFELGKAYQECGDAGVFVLYSAICEAEKKLEATKTPTEKEAVGDYGAGGGYSENTKTADTTEHLKPTMTFENVMRLSWYQNEKGNDDLLGFSMTREAYNKLAKENAAKRYAEEKLIEMKLEGEDAKTKKQELIDEALQDEELLVEYGYKKKTDETTIRGYGCTLATAAYIAYSITGKVVSLKEANEILKENDIFISGIDKNGISEKNLIGRGDGYAKAVNTIAGGTYLETDGKEYSNSNSSAIFHRLIENKKDTNNVYFTHIRIDNGAYDHSVLLKSFSYSNQYDARTATLNVYNPWKEKGAEKTQIGFDKVKRADFYRLTEAGKTIYQLNNAFQNATTNKAEKYINLRKAA